MRKFGHVNPYTEILARALYNKETTVTVPVDDFHDVLDSIGFMNNRTYVAKFRLNMTGDTVHIDYKAEDHQDD